MKKWDHLKRNIIKLQGLYLLILVFLLAGCGKIGNTDTWVVEVHVLEKETVTREDKDTGTEEVFLLNCEDEAGDTQVFELTDTALDGKYEAEKAFKELKTGKYYKFRVGWRGPGIEGRSGHHPSIYGAVKMEGFDLEYLPNNIDDGDQDTKTAEEASQSGEDRQATESSRSGEDQRTEESTWSGEDQRAKERSRSGEDRRIEGSAQSKEDLQPRETEGSRQQESEPAEAESNGELPSESLQEDIQAKLEESFAAEKESLAKEQESLEEKLRELEQELKRLEGEDE